jgi:hypothetical protein
MHRLHTSRWKETILAVHVRYHDGEQVNSVKKGKNWYSTPRYGPRVFQDSKADVALGSITSPWFIWSNGSHMLAWSQWGEM